MSDTAGSDNVTIDDAGVTVIVGPNGSGKSNISDAMRWVLGEISSKTLRGSKMEDVIFGGADSRKPMGYAEVSVTFDNTRGGGHLECPYDEVTVTRRYYRAGESEYFINRRPVRLKDIYELFMNTGVGREGYSIIGQGKIDEIISKKSDERRAVFEDASGIAKFRHRKNEAERKLEQTEDNMTRVRDIFAEVEAQVGPLAKEAEKAKKAIELTTIKKQADIGLWLYDTEKLRGDLAEAQNLFKRSSFDLQQAEEAVQSLEAQNDRLFEQSQSNKQESERLLTDIRRLTEESHSLESEYRVSETQISHWHELSAAAEETIATVERSVKAEEDKRKEQLTSLDELRAKADALTREQDDLTESVRSADERITAMDEMIDNALDDITEREQEAVDLRVRISVLENARDTDDGRNQGINDQLKEYQTVSADLEEKCAEKRQTVDQYAAQIADLSEKKQAAEEECTALETALQAEEKNYNGTKLRRDSVEQKINTYRDMEEHLEGYSNSVKYVMNRYAEGQIRDREGLPCGKIYGPLSQVISVSDAYVTAIETALSGNLQNIVVENEQTAKAAMFCLKRGEAGRATFYPLTSMQPPMPSKAVTDAAGYPGYVDTADRLVDCRPEFKVVIEALLGHTVVFDNIDNATNMAKAQHYRVRVVTLDGQQINAGGSFSGGSVKQNGAFLSRAAQVKRLQGELDELEKTLGSLNAKITAAGTELDKKRNGVSDLEVQISLLQTLSNTETAALEQVSAKLQANRSLEEKLANDFRQMAEERAQYEQELVDLKQREGELQHQIDEMKAAREDKYAARNDLAESRDTMARRSTEVLMEQSDVKKDMETAALLAGQFAERISGLKEEIAGLKQKIDNYARQIRETEEKQQSNRADNGRYTEELEKLNAKRTEIEADGLEFERKLSELSIRRRDRTAQKDMLILENSKNENKVNALLAEQDKLQTRLWDDYEMTRNDAIAQGFKPVEASERAAVARTQIECRNKLRVLGNVDFDAVEKYEDVKTRYETMKVQIEDLEKSRADLVDIITRLEKEMKSSFVDAFNQINENFGKVFAELFGGGSAEITLTDPDNVLESGIEIKAAPPGKIIKSLLQLSGGEQAFIGVALFFAILKVNPTPFCILDEIEAALDEVNVARLSQYIRRYHDTQFIMITHRRGTMEAATRLYGVTMPEHGISKVLSLDVDDIAKKKGGEWDGLLE